MSNYANVYSYMRISTTEERAVQKFSRQEKSIRAYVKNNNLELLLEFKDDYSGASFDRPEWKRLERILKKDDTVIFKDISRFTRQANEGYNKYIELMQKDINLVFLDNMTVSTEYIKNLTKIATEQDLVARTALESTIKLLLIVELDRVQKEREIIVRRIRQGIEASSKKSGRREGQLDKMTDALERDIQEYLSDRSIKQVDLMRKHDISRNTLKKYIKIVQDKQNYTVERDVKGKIYKQYKI